MTKLAICLIFAGVIFGTASGHGRLMDPPARNSMWRAGFDTPKNYNDMGLNCGGVSTQWDGNGGQCGLCGDSFTGTRFHEAGGRYAPVNRPIARCYNTQEKTMSIDVRMTAYHKGYFEFRLCENNDLTKDPGQDCLDKGHLLTIAGSGGETRYDINGKKLENYRFELDLPTVTCSQCILQWKYNTGNSYGCDNTGCDIGLGPQEQFINCADIAILEDCEGLATASPDNDDDDDDDNDDTPTTTPQAPVATTTTLAEDDTTDAVTTQPPPPTTQKLPDPDDDVICVPTDPYINVPNMYDWCESNCLRPQNPYCPQSHCVCIEL